MRPPFAYFGGKYGMSARIVSLMPPHRVYIEPFFGSGAVFFAKRPATHEIINDLDGAVVTFFRCLRERTDELEHACSLTPYAREEYEQADIDATDDELEIARRFWVRINQSFAKTAGNQTGWSVTTARTQATAASVWSRIGRFGECARRLMNVSIECCDAADLVERMATDDAVIYVDPPYLAATRVSRQDRQRPEDYRRDMGGDSEHRRLAEVLHATPAVVILSGYPGDLYDELYADWWSMDVNVTAHSSNAATTSRTSRVERLWANRELDRGQMGFVYDEEVV
jgi:DNA adenine methylase